MNQPSSLSVAFYARVSSDQQAKEQTIDSQIQLLSQRIEQDGLLLRELLGFVDDGYTGSSLQRPALERLRDQVAAGVIDRLYVLAPDRLARKYAYQVLLLDEFKRHRVEVIFLNRAIGTSPEEDLLLPVQGMIAEYERAKILERSRRGRLHAARRGSLSVLHCAPYGYRYLDRHHHDGQGTFVVHEAEAEIVRRIFAWVTEQRCTLGEVRRRLSQAGIPSPKGNRRWSRSSLAALLRNSTYCGSALYGKSRTGEPRPRLRPGKGRPEQPRRPGSRYATDPSEQIVIATPALISREQFQTAAEQMAENQRRHRQGQRGATYLLQGLIECAGCGHAFYGKRVSSVYQGKRSCYTYYRCVGCEAYRTGGERLCWNRQVRTDRLEEAVWQDVTALLGDPQRLQAEAQRRFNGSAGQPIDRGRLHDQIRRSKAGLSRVIDAYENELLDRSEFEQRARRLKDRLNDLQREVQKREEEEANEKRVEEVMEQWQQFAKRITQGLREADWATRRAIIRALVKRVEVDREEIRVVYRIPPGPVAETPACSLPDCPDNPHSSQPTK
jgi:site-specific DNA recombinase